MPWMKIKCGHCGHDADINQWTSTPISGALPVGHYQCPACGIAFKRQIGKTEIRQGYRIPGKTSLVPVQGSL